MKQFFFLQYIVTSLTKCKTSYITFYVQIHVLLLLLPTYNAVKLTSSLKETMEVAEAAIELDEAALKRFQVHTRPGTSFTSEYLYYLSNARSIA